jgi:hypothetical protein
LSKNEEKAKGGVAASGLFYASVIEHEGER